MEDYQIERSNKMHLSDSDIKTLEKYDISYLTYNSIKELLFEVETILNNCYVDDDLEELSIKLSEYNYYFDTNK